MKVTLLGTGTSTGVPQVGCGCKVCRSADPRDRRLRSAALLDTDDGRRLLFDCGPDFRAQMLSVDFKRLDAVFITHEHYDHVGGLDDLRPFCVYGDVDVFAQDDCADDLQARLPYCFAEHPYPGVPRISLRRIRPGEPVHVGEAEVWPFRVMHGQLPILGYRVGRFAYVTDMTGIAPDDLHCLEGLDCLVVNALRFEPHPTHQSLAEALALVERLSPRTAYFTHMSHGIGLHEETEKLLPPHVHLGYDGLTIEV